MISTSGQLIFGSVILGQILYTYLDELHCRMDMVAIERVQKRFIKILPGIEDCSSKEGLDSLGLFWHMSGWPYGWPCRGLWGVITTLDSQCIFLSAGMFRTCWHSFKWEGRNSKENWRIVFFIQKGGGWLEWDSRRGGETDTLAVFKRELDKYLDRKGVEHIMT